MQQLSYFIANLIDFYSGLIIVWVILSWIPKQQDSFMEDLFIVIGNLVLPYLNVFRRLIPVVGGIDFSPVFGILLLEAIQRLLYTL